MPTQERLNSPPKEALTRRQLEVLTLLCQGFNAGEIAVQLSITPATVKTTLGHLSVRLEVTGEHRTCKDSKVLAILKAFKFGLVSPEILQDQPIESP